MTSPKVLTEDWITTLDRGEQDALEAGGQPHLQDLSHGPGVDAQLPQVQVQGAGVLCHAAQHQSGGDALGDHRGDGDARHIQVTDDDEEQIQHDVHHARQGEEVQRTLGVALRPQQSCAEVVDHGGGHAQEVDPQVQRRKAQHVVRCLHPGEDGPGAEKAHHRQQHAAQDTQQDGGVDHPVELLPVPGAEALGGQGVGAHRQTHEQVRQKADQRRVGAHRRQGVVSGPAAHHHDVRRVEEQLQHAGAHQRDGEAQHPGEDGAVAHVDLILRSV